MFALYINESQAVPFYEGHNPIFTWIWGVDSHEKFIIFFLTFLILYLLFYLWTIKSISPSVAFYVIWPQKRESGFTVNFAVVFGGVRVNLVPG